jgi:hypothetical protein
VECDASKKKMIEDLLQQIRIKAAALSDLDVILEDYGQERRRLLHEIGNLKATLWESVGDSAEWAALELNDTLEISNIVAERKAGGVEPRSGDGVT